MYNFARVGPPKPLRLVVGDQSALYLLVALKRDAGRAEEADMCPSEPEEQTAPESPRPTWRGQIPPVVGREAETLREDLLRAGTLLRDGMLKLQNFVQSMHVTLHEMGECIERAQTMRDETSQAALLTQLQQLQITALTQTDQAFIGLQLEDILSQLLDYANRRAGGLSSVALATAEILRHGAFPNEHAALDELTLTIATVNQRANERAVTQESMSTGDVELF